MSSGLEPVFLYNPGSSEGRSGAAYIETLRRRYADLFGDASTVETDPASQVSIVEIRRLTEKNATPKLIVAVGGDETARIGANGVAGTGSALLPIGFGNGCMTARLCHGDKDFSDPTMVFNGLGKRITHHLLRLMVNETAYDATFMAGFGVTALGAVILDTHRKKWGHGLRTVREIREFASAAAVTRQMAAGKLLLDVTALDADLDRRLHVLSEDISHAPWAAKYLANPGFSLRERRALLTELRSAPDLPRYALGTQTGTYGGEIITDIPRRWQVHTPSFYHVDGTPFPLKPNDTVSLGFSELSYDAIVSTFDHREPPPFFHPRVVAAYLGATAILRLTKK
ncbi:MAG: hypothetical protein WBP03_05800 [Candidatus Saccharimonadales bacterium]